MASDWAIALSKKELTIVKRMSIVESVNGNSLGEERGIMLKKLREEDAHLEAHFFIPKRDK